MTLPPGSTIGIIGGGQLGRMLAMAAARLGYRTIVLEPQADCPAAQVANRQIAAAYDEAAALAELAALCAVVTYEFENVPVNAARNLAASVAVYPPPLALEISQDRVTEKRFLNEAGLSTADFFPVENDAGLASALQASAAAACSRQGVWATTARGSAFSAMSRQAVLPEPARPWEMSR